MSRFVISLNDAEKISSNLSIIWSFSNSQAKNFDEATEVRFLHLYTLNFLMKQQKFIFTTHKIFHPIQWKIFKRT